MIDVFSILISSSLSVISGVVAYGYQKHQKRLDKLENDKVGRDILDIELRNMKDDVKEIKENVEYIRRKVEKK